MKVQRIEPKVITYSLSFDRDDEEYYQCLWARFVFDCDNGRLNINSDAGNFTYGWGYNEHEDFMSLMGRINSEYLLNKIANREFFNCGESKKETIQEIRENGVDYYGIKDAEHLATIIEEIEDISSYCSEESFYNKVDAIVPHIDFEAIHIIKDYPCEAKVVCQLFEKYIQPKIKEDFCNK